MRTGKLVCLWGHERNKLREIKDKNHPADCSICCACNTHALFTTRLSNMYAYERKYPSQWSVYFNANGRFRIMSEREESKQQWIWAWQHGRVELENYSVLKMRSNYRQKKHFANNICVNFNSLCNKSKFEGFFSSHYNVFARKRMKDE